MAVVGVVYIICSSHYYSRDLAARNVLVSDDGTAKVSPQ